MLLELVGLAVVKLSGAVVLYVGVSVPGLVEVGASVHRLMGDEGGTVGAAVSGLVEDGGGTVGAAVVSWSVGGLVVIGRQIGSSLEGPVEAYLLLLLMQSESSSRPTQFPERTLEQSNTMRHPLSSVYVLRNEQESQVSQSPMEPTCTEQPQLPGVGTSNVCSRHSASKKLGTASNGNESSAPT